MLRKMNIIITAIFFVLPVVTEGKIAESAQFYSYIALHIFMIY